MDEKEYLSTNGFSIDSLSLPVEIPYIIDLKIKAESNTINYADAFSKYLLDRHNYLNTVKVKVSSSRTFNGFDLFPEVKGENIIDGNLGEYSTWVSHYNINTMSYLVLDLGEVKNIAAIMWSSIDWTGQPSVYKILVSDDNKTWKIAKNITRKTPAFPIEKFDPMIKGRFMKMEIYSTLQGTPPNIDEMEVVTLDGNSILASYNDFHSLIKDASFFSQKNESSPIIIGQLLVTTKSPTAEKTIPMSLSLPVDSTFHTYSLRINDSERGSLPGEFLKRDIVKVELNLPSNKGIVVADFRIRPTELLSKYLQSY